MTRVSYALLAALLLAYAVQVATPLRLTVDSVQYLTIADSIADGHGIPAGADFPPGLPALYALLDGVGLGTTWAIVAANLAFLKLALACSLWLYARVFRIAPAPSALLACGTLLSYVLVKHAALALSDVPFLGVVSAALVAFTRAATERRRAALAFGFVLTAAAVATRTAVSRPSRPPRGRSCASQTGLCPSGRGRGAARPPSR